MRDVSRRLTACLWAAVAAGVIVSFSPAVRVPSLTSAAGSRPATRLSVGERGTSRAAQSSGQTAGVNAEEAGTYIPGSESAALTVPVAELTARIRTVVAPLRRLLPADLLVVAPRTLPASALAAVRRQGGVTAAELVDAARVELNGSYVAMLGVDPSQFRAYAAKPTAQSTVLWQNVADGAVAVSYLMGQQ
ncbi:MAG TPA: hypothetical protein VEL03_00315, partial [Streptosporangiaceae bacterium]|nr:hypothetical protein [Streptosporangiaceae bacterium]